MFYSNEHTVKYLLKVGYGLAQIYNTRIKSTRNLVARLWVKSLKRLMEHYHNVPFYAVSVNIYVRRGGGGTTNNANKKEIVKYICSKQNSTTVSK